MECTSVPVCLSLCLGSCSDLLLFATCGNAENSPTGQHVMACDMDGHPCVQDTRSAPYGSAHGIFMFVMFLPRGTSCAPCYSPARHRTDGKGMSWWQHGDRPRHLQRGTRMAKCRCRGYGRAGLHKRCCKECHLGSELQPSARRMCIHGSHALPLPAPRADSRSTPAVTDSRDILLSISLGGNRHSTPCHTLLSDAARCHPM